MLNLSSISELSLLQLHFKGDAGEQPVEMVHKLKLYADDAGGQISKKPVGPLATPFLVVCK